MLSETVAKYPQRPAVRWADGCWSYVEFDREITKMAKGFLSLGLTIGSHAALWTEPSPRAVAAFFALQRIGAVVILLNTCLKGGEIEKQLTCSDAEYVILEGEEKAQSFLEACRSGREAGFAEGELCLGQTVRVKTVLLSRLTDEPAWAQPMPAPDPNAVAMMLFTSGTTSANYKVVCSSGAQLASSGRMKADDMRMTEEDVVCCALPMFHTFCINCNLLASAAAGACLILPPDRHSETTLTYIERYRCTMLTAVPSVYLTLIARPDLRPERVASLRCGIVGGAYCSPEQFRAIEGKLGMTLLPGLGQSEVIAGVTIASPEESLEVRSNTLGHFVDRLEGRIVGHEVPMGEGDTQAGEIQVRGPMVMLGYYENGKVVSAVDEDGWLHTGDLGWQDAAGNIHYAGRIKDIIIRGGENIMPSEIEAVLSGDVRISCCKAVGIPDDHYGEVPCICIVPGSEAALSEAQVRSAMCQRLAAFKVPKFILFFSKFPYTNTGKINCKKVAAIARQTILGSAQ